MWQHLIAVPSFIPPFPPPCERGGSLEVLRGFVWNVTFQCHLCGFFREALEGCAWPRECGDTRGWIFHPHPQIRLGLFPSFPWDQLPGTASPHLPLPRGAALELGLECLRFLELGLDVP